MCNKIFLVFMSSRLLLFSLGWRVRHSGSIRGRRDGEVILERGQGPQKEVLLCYYMFVCTSGE